MELGLLLGVLAVALTAGFALLRRPATPPSQRRWFAFASIVAITATALAARELYDPPVPEFAVTDRPIEVATEAYGTSDSCQACHPGEHAAWKASYHSSMTQKAAPETVLGDFEDRVLKDGSHEFRLSREDDAYWVDMPDIDTYREGGAMPRVKRRIVMTTGSHHMQAYWYGTDNTRVLGLLPFVYNVLTDRWQPRHASFILPPSNEPTSELGRWNKVCLECHVTQGRLRPIEVDGVDTNAVEFGISCESCHGPAADHVASQGNVLTRYATRLGGDAPGNVVQPKRLSHERSSEVCGQCHSTSVWTSQEALDEFMEHGFAYRPGDRLADSKAIVRGKLEWNTPAVQSVLSFQEDLIPNTFWSDGMNRIAGREYNGLIETGCFTRGEMSCLSCHQLHKPASDDRSMDVWRDDQLKPGMRGNLACVQCHTEYGDAGAVEAHTRHPAESYGSTCYNCHMPHTTYGLLKAIRSHQIDSPSVQVAVDTGRPNACNQCHLDKPLGWTAKWLDEWYGIPEPRLTPEQRLVAAVPLMSIVGDAGQRALAAWSMSWAPALEISGDHWQGLYLGILLGGDPYPAVRQIAHRSLTQLPGFANFEYDPLAPDDALHEAGNAALEQWVKRYALEGVPIETVLIGAQGPQMDVLLELLQQRDDRPVAFAE